MYVFGGCTATNTTFNDLWRFDLSVHEWTRLLTTGTYPSPKAYATMLTWRNFLILFGGWTHPSLNPLHQQWVLYNELHVYDVLANRWTALYYPGCPPPTAGHSATIHGDVMVMVGGLQKHEGTSLSTSDIYCLDLLHECWFKPLVSEVAPLPRYGHSQIKIDNKHILIMAGSGGLNKLYSDYWLLTLPDDIYNRSAVWNWEQLFVEGTEFTPTQLWYSPACSLGNSIVVLSTGPLSNNTTGTMSQLLIPGMIRRQAANVWVPPVQHEPGPVERVQPERPAPEVNVNGQRGFLRPGARVFDMDSSSDENEDNNHLPGSARSRPRPSIRPNASSDRARRLQLLSKMEVRLRSLSRPQENQILPNKVDTNKEKISNRPTNRASLIPHLLDISKVLTKKTVTWWLPNVQENGSCLSIGNSPQPCLLYSLLLGRGHLIMFGGIPNDLIGGESYETVSNTVSFISAPSSTYTAI